MKTGKTVKELSVELVRQKGAKRDFIVPTTNMRLIQQPILDTNEQSENRINRMLVALKTNEDKGEFFVANELMHSQIGLHTDIPAKYYNKMLLQQPELLSQNVNTWLTQQPNNRMVRTLDGTARAFLSERYRRIDNDQIAEAVLPIIGRMPEARVESCELTDTRMYLKVVNPRLQGEVSKGDIVQAGIIISNSEVGHGAVKVQPLIFRLVCLNGMVINDLGQKKYHVGRINDESMELFRNETIEADDKAFLMKVQDTVRASVDEAMFNRALDKMRESKGAKIDGNVTDVVELASKQYKLNQTEQDSVLQHLINDGELSLYGLGNAVTRTAQDVESYDRSTDLEGIGWNMLNMSRQDWHNLNHQK